VSGAPGSAPLGGEGLARLAAPALDLAERPAGAGAESAVEVEVVVQRSSSGLTRFANSEIHQHVWTDEVTAGVRVVVPGGRVGVVGVTSDRPANVRQAAEEALDLARLAPPDPDFPGLAPSAPVESIPVDVATTAQTPADRADEVAALLAEVPDQFAAAGAYTSGDQELGVFTSTGQAATTRLSNAAVTVVVTGSTSSGYGQAGGRAAGELNPAEVGKRAVAKARAGADPVDVDPGDWPVVLEPPATGTLVQFLSYLGFGGRAYLEGRAFTSERLGDAALDPRLTIVDDAFSPNTVGYPFDFEGTPKQRVALVRDGVLAAVVHDRATGARAGTSSTGHGLPAPNTFGPLALNALLQPGDGGSVEDLIAGCERGLCITRFHYTNVVHPFHTVITGMTRDGTFLIEDGRIVSAVRNLRFMQSILEGLAEVEAVSTETGYSTDLFAGGSRAPALRLPAFAFTSTTTFG
jgi:PmbA protein